MGTSASFPTPSGGDWTPAKQAVSNAVGQGQPSPAKAARIVARTLRAVGGLQAGASGNARRATIARAGGGGGGAARGGRTRSTSGILSSLGGFGASLRDGGLGQALDSLGLSGLRGQSAAEVVSRVAEHLANGVDGLIYETAYAALIQALYDAAQLADQGSFEALDTGLQAYLNQHGPEGLAALFLEQFVFARVWTAVENHASSHARSNGEHEALLRSVANWCREQVQALFDEHRANGRFEQVDWFGRRGLTLANSICDAFEDRLAAASEE